MLMCYGLPLPGGSLPLPDCSLRQIAERRLHSLTLGGGIIAASTSPTAPLVMDGLSSL